MLDLAVEMAKTPVEVPPGLAEQLRQRFSEPELIELSAAIAWENYRARFNRVFGVGPSGSQTGQFVRSLKQDRQCGTE